MAMMTVMVMDGRCRYTATGGIFHTLEDSVNFCVVFLRLMSITAV